MSFILYETVLKYLFAFVNCLQGSFLFVYYFLLNEEVRRYLKSKHRNQYLRDPVDNQSLDGVEFADTSHGSRRTSTSNSSNLGRAKLYKNTFYKYNDNGENSNYIHNENDKEVEKTLRKKNTFNETITDSNNNINKNQNIESKKKKHLKNQKLDKKKGKKYNLSLNDTLVIQKKKKFKKNRFFLKIYLKKLLLYFFCFVLFILKVFETD